MTEHKSLRNRHLVRLKDMLAASDMQPTLPLLFQILPQKAPDMRGDVHAVLTENQRGHHYLEGLDLLS